MPREGSGQRGLSLCLLQATLQRRLAGALSHFRRRKLTSELGSVLPWGFTELAESGLGSRNSIFHSAPRLPRKAHDLCAPYADGPVTLIDFLE